MSSNNENSVEELRRKVQDQLKLSGMDKLIKNMVESICSSKDDPQGVNPDEVLQEIYSRGLMSSVLNLDSGHPNLFQSEHEIGKHQLTNNNAWEGGDGTTGWLEKLRNQSDGCNNDGENGKRYYLRVEILGGKCFLDHLSHEKNSSQTTCKSQTLALHLFFKAQKFKSKPVECQSNPNFQEDFVLDVGHFEGGNGAAQLLAVKEQLRLLIIREDSNHPVSGGGVIISFTLHDWRSALLTDNGFESFALEMFGVGEVGKSCSDGILNLKISVLPCPSVQISEETMVKYLHSEKTIHEEAVRHFASFTKNWMNDFLSIRPGHIFRNVKLSALDEKLISRPISTFVRLPQNADRVFPTPFHAAWFVSLFSVDSNCHNRNESIHNLQSLELTIISKHGTAEDLSILLCSLLLGFGLNAFVAFGSERNGHLNSWVITLDNSFQPMFWEPTTGKRFIKPVTQTLSESFELSNEGQDIGESIIIKKFHNIGCLFNNESFHCNIQAGDSVVSVDWDLSNPGKWKYIPPKIMAKFPHQTDVQFVILPPNVDCELIAARMEIRVQELIEEARKGQELPTRWERTTSKLMGQHLATSELQASTGGSNFENFFETIILNSIPAGYDFKGFHYHSGSTNAKNLFQMSCMGDHQCQDVVFCRGEDVQHSVRVSIFSYPENVLSIRLMIGCKFNSCPVNYQCTNHILILNN